MGIEQYSFLAPTLENLVIHVCCPQEIHIQSPSSVVRLSSPFNPLVNLHSHFSGDFEAAASGLVGLGVTPNERDWVALLHWIPVDSCLCTVKLRGPCKVRTLPSDRHTLFALSAFAPCRLLLRYNQKHLSKVAELLTHHKV